MLENVDLSGEEGARIAREEPAIRTSRLTFAYPGSEEPVVKNLDFAISRGEIFGFLGPSGAGKSTTQRILIKLLEGHEGSVEVLGKNLSDWGAEYYERIGVSFELPNHYQKLTALENLNFFRSLYAGETEDPMRLLDMVGLAGDANTRVSQFSKGMQMRLTFVRALLHRPELIFLDEPTSGLDPRNARKVREIILSLKAEGRTIFLTTHDMTVADVLCDRVAFLVDGRMAAMDSPRELKLRRGERTVRVEYRDGETGGHLARREFPLDGLADDAAFLYLLREHHVETMHTEEATLEDVFVATTGRSLS